MRPKEKGKRYERELVILLRSYGWKARRIPASVIDVIATKNDKIVIFEIKFTKNNRIKVSKEQIMKIFDWLSLFDYYKIREAVIAIKFKNKDWVFKKACEIKDYIIKADDKSDWGYGFS